ncbi:MAG: M12 family metallo-peptidase [Pyrinomonadaceae bacterium]
MTPVNSFRHQYSRTRVALVALVFTVVVAALAFSSRDVSSQGGDPQRRDLDRVFSRHDRLSLDPGQIQRQVKQTRSLTLNTSRGRFEMTLEPHDIRAPGYRAEAWGDKGVTVLERAPVRTYKGTVQGLPGAQARMTIDEQTVEGLIVTPSELFFLEPSKRFSASAAKTDFVFYAASDVKESAGECGTTMAQMVAQHSTEVSNQSSAKGPQPEALFGPALEIGIATEADFEYFTALGSEAAAVAKIVEIMNQVDGIYNVQLGLKFMVMNTRVWTTASDPYTTPVAPATTIDASTALNEFRTYYNGNAPAQAAGRDTAHLWTGRDFTGSTIGIAFQPGLDCPFDSQGEGSYAYGISQHLTSVNANLAGLTAHEIGHNFSASHVTSAQGSDCGDPGTATTSIMNPSISATTNFCQFSKDEITNLSIAVRNCLTPLTQPGCTYAISPDSQGIPAGGGGGSVTVTTTAGCNWAVAEGDSWLTVTGGASGTGSGTVNYSATSNSVCGPRSALMSIGGQPFTVNQAGNPNYLTDLSTATAIAPFQTLTGDLSLADCPYGVPGLPGNDRRNAFMDRYKFDGTAGQNILIEMNAAIPPPQSGGVDTYLYLIFLDGTPDGSIVAQNDDIQLGSLTNSRIPCTNVADVPCKVEYFTLPQTGTYIIIATSFSDSETGAYSLSLTPLTLFTVQGGGPAAASLNSVTFTKTSNLDHTALRIFDPLNFSADQTTRLILFTTNLGLPETLNPLPADLLVRAGGRDLVVEHVGPIAFPGLNGSYVIVSLGQLKTPPLSGNLEFKVILYGKESTGPSITIAP